MKFGREEVLPWRGRKFTRILSLGGEFVLRIFSPPEEISGGRFYPVTPVPAPQFNYSILGIYIILNTSLNSKDQSILCIP